jgi:hypothetical protein
VHGVTITDASLLAEALERFSSLGERESAQWRAIWPHQHVERYEPSRRFGRQTADAAFRRVKPRLQRVEGHASVQLDNQLAIHHESFDRDPHERRHNFGEKAGERRPGLAF